MGSFLYSEKRDLNSRLSGDEVEQFGIAVSRGSDHERIADPVVYQATSTAVVVKKVEAVAVDQA